jgi:hypothetical protein
VVGVSSSRFILSILGTSSGNGARASKICRVDNGRGPRFYKELVKCKESVKA